jgi:NAD(P)-dependent dehydrogenase (short-subunit alcohol dehydrogenase family)
VFRHLKYLATYRASINERGGDMQTTLHDRVCVVTGATAGMGKATAAALAAMGATVVLVARNRAKGEAVRDEIRQRSGNPNVDVLVADLASQQSIRDLAATIKKQYPQIHVLVNNAGGIFFKRTTTVDGLETTFALNHLAYFLLTNLLLDTLVASAPARIINISSNSQAVGRIDFDNLQRERRYMAFGAYAQSKLANVLFTYELARRLEGTGVTVNTITPGPVATNFGLGGKGVLKLFPMLFRVIGTSAEQGAETAIYLASSPDVEGVTGKAFYRCEELATSPRSYDRALQQRLWQVSEGLVVQSASR